MALGFGFGRFRQTCLIAAAFAGLAWSLAVGCTGSLGEITTARRDGEPAGVGDPDGSLFFPSGHDVLGFRTPRQVPGEEDPPPTMPPPTKMPPAGPSNPFGIGLVGPGSSADLDLVGELAGPGGHVKMIFPGVTRASTGPEGDWVRALNDAYDRGLVPVIRIGPPWGQMTVRTESDDGEHMRYSALAAAYRRVVEGLPRRAGTPLWLEIHNEPNLCYEWVCAAGSVAGDWIGYEQIAHEYAAMLRDVADELHAIGDPTIRVINGGLAPGGARRCQCGGDGYEAGITSQEFLTEMRAAVPDIFDRLDGFASHSYPAGGVGYDFFVPFERAATGLLYFERELAIVGRDLPVLMTETGWCVPGSRCPAPGGDRDAVADWTVRAYQEFWARDPRIVAAMPFILRDSGWEDFAWIAPDGGKYPVFNQVRDLRCATMADGCGP